MQNSVQEKMGREWLLKEKYDGIETPAFEVDCKRLAFGEPLAYIIGHIPFLDRRIFLDSHPLIPRPETEYWTMRAITEITQKGGPVHVLDLCAGSGCIGIAVLSAVPSVRVDFAEINASHHPTILKNLRENGIEESRARFFGGDLFADIPPKNTYDFILANPPYIDPGKTERVQDSVLRYEPSEALFGGIGGMEIIRRILEEAPWHLALQGVLYIEHEPEQSEAIAILADSPAYISCQTFPDQWGVGRYTVLTAC